MNSMMNLNDSEQFRLFSNIDLLSVILGESNIKETARYLFEPSATYGTAKEFAEKAQTTQCKALKALALAELLKRAPIKTSKEVASLRNSEDIYNYVKEDFIGLDHEELFVLFLNKALKPIQQVRFSIGSYVGTMFDVRQILRKGLELKATSMVLQHNHPSGNLIPSTQDKDITEQLRKAGQLMTISLLDHIIVTNDAYYSFSDNGLLNDRI